MSSAIVVSALTAVRQVGFWQRPVKILRDVSFTVQSGTVHGLVGQNGAGKSTTIQHVVGAAKPSSGVVRICGLDPLLPAARRSLAYHADPPVMPSTLTCAEVIRLHASLAGVSAPIDVLERCGIGDRRDVLVARLSKGQQTRLSLALTLLGEPSAFVLDEPMSGLDPLGRDFVRSMILGHAQRGATVLFSSHSLTDVEQLCDRITVLHHGRVLLDGSVRGLTGATDAAGSEVAVTVPEGWSPPPGMPGTPRGGVWVVDVPDDGLDAARRLVESGAELVHVQRSRPKLEDVVLRLMRESGA
jgi:ABC-type multidrug transport system ATPase subunit